MAQARGKPDHSDFGIRTSHVHGTAPDLRPPVSQLRLAPWACEYERSWAAPSYDSLPVKAWAVQFSTHDRLSTTASRRGNLPSTAWC